LTVHEGGTDAPAKKMLNHYGVRVTTKREVDAAYDYLTARKDEYGLPEIRRPAFSHGSYSLYFLEPGTNGWEIECYEDALRKETGGIWVGGVRTPHWETVLPPERFPGRGYVPQAFTHGTLASADIAVSGRFYAEVLGLEVVRARQQVVYIKHPKTKSYIVSVVRAEPPTGYSPNFRFSLEMESSEALTEAHRRLESAGQELGMSELGEIQNDGGLASFLLRDPDRNCWELFA
jgi:catechol 2,3-dioxygenase-like lactoylglutathione lyase family enzyme